MEKENGEDRGEDRQTYAELTGLCVSRWSREAEEEEEETVRLTYR